MKRKPGRPPRVGKKSDDERITIRVAKVERRAWQRAAGKQTLSDWLRSLANKASQP